MTRYSIYRGQLFPSYKHSHRVVVVVVVVVVVMPLYAMAKYRKYMMYSCIQHHYNYYLAYCDCWCRGVGCIFCEMICGRPVFPGSNTEEELILIWKVRT